MKTIVWDIDDVLNNLTEEWLNSFKKQYSRVDLDYNELKINPPHDLLGLTKQEYLQDLDRFRFEKLMDLKPNPILHKWFQDNGHRFHHIALTAQPIAVAPLGANWVLSNFGSWIRGFFYIPSPRDSDPAFTFFKEKADLLDWYNFGDYFIDDSEMNLNKVADSKIQKFLFPQPWNARTYTIEEILYQIKP